jgi:hypothetical protein
MGPEAGEPLAKIVSRKEAERVACGGLFYWGIGSAVGPAVAALVAEVETPEVLFSPIKGPPRKVDAAPAYVARWHSGLGPSGERIELSSRAVVTSRWDPSRPMLPRYALVCSSTSPLEVGHQAELRLSELRNLCSGAALGSSQVTAVVRHDRDGTGAASGRSYPVAFRASLVFPYVLRLTDPVPYSRDADPLEPPDLRLAA